MTVAAEFHPLWIALPFSLEILVAVVAGIPLLLQLFQVVAPEKTEPVVVVRLVAL